MKNVITYSISLFLIVFSASASAQMAGNSVYEQMKNAPTQRNQPVDKNFRSLNGKLLTIEANALMNVVPDAQIVIFSLVQLGSTAQEATELMDSKINPIKAGLKELGIQGDDIVMDMISFVPRYEDTLGKKRFSTTYTEIPKGFELKKNLHIKFKDQELIDKIIAICAANEVYDIAKVEYVILESEENKRKLRDKMLKHVADKIAFYHQLKVQDSISIKLINEQVKEFYPMDSYHKYTAFSSSSYQAVNTKRRAKNVSKVTKNESIFYDPMTAKNFDIVINPGELKPTVQYTYKLTVHYELPPPLVVQAPEPKVIEKVVETKEYILITPNGDTKTLKF